MPPNPYSAAPWWAGVVDQSPGQNVPLGDYATRMRSAMAPADAGGVQNPLVAALAGYQPPAYQTTPPHVDVDAIIAAMNAQKSAAMPSAGGASMAAGGMIPQGEGAQMAGGERAVGGMPNMQEFRDAMSGAKAAFAGMPGAIMDGLSGNDGMVSGAALEQLNAEAAANSAGGAPGLAKGGPVKTLGGPDPAGPDDGYAALDKGEYVVKKDAAKKVGSKAMNAINKGDPDVAEGVKEVTRRLEAKDRGKRKDTDRDGDKKRDTDKDGM